MRQFKLEAYKKYFPFIPEDFQGDVIVKTLDEDILIQSFEDRYWDGSLGSDEDIFKIDFIFEDGEIIKNAVKMGEYSGSNYAHSSTVDVKGETIAEAIDRLNIANKLQYIAVYNKGYSNWEGSPVERWDNLTIYSLPPEVNIGDIIIKLKKEAEEKVKKEIELGS